MSIIKSGTTSTTAYTVEGNTDGDLSFVVNGSLTAATLDTSGNLGIGTSSPSSLLHLSSSSPAVQFSETDVGTENYVQASGGAFNFFADDNNAVADTTIGFFVDGTRRATIDSSGNLGLGVTPRAWAGGYKSYDIAGPGAIASTASGDTFTQVAHGSWFNGTNWIYQYTGVGAARYQMTGPSGGGNHSWYVAGTGTAGDPISFTQAMTLDASGRLGIGTSSPGSLLHLNATNPVLRLSGSTSGNCDIQTDGVSFLINADSGNTAASSNIAFRVDNTERARIDSSGNLVVGGTTANGKLDVYGILAVSNSVGNYWAFDRDDANGGLKISDGTTERARLDSLGNLGVGTASPGNFYRLTINGAGTSGNPVGGITFRQNETDVLYLGNVATDNNTDFEIFNPRNGYVRIATNNIERVRIDSSGIVTTPYQPSFSAYLAANENRSSGTSVVGGTWGTQHNTGGHYSTSTRRFTAPVSGVYVFQCIIATVGGAGTFSYLSAELWVNGSRVRVGGWGGGGPSYGQTSSSYTIYLNANDYAELASESSKAFTLQSGAHTMLAGFLVG